MITGTGLLSIFLTITAIVAVAVVVVFIAAYSSMFDWHKSPMGRVMNLSLFANALVFSGLLFRFALPDVMVILMIVGMVIFSTAIVFRLKLLIKAGQQAKSEYNPDHGVGRAERISENQETPLPVKLIK